MNGVKFLEIRGITDAADEDAARSFHAHLGDVMVNVVELLVAWAMTRRSGA